jgi:hypothetical protein
LLPRRGGVNRFIRGIRAPALRPGTNAMIFKKNAKKCAFVVQITDGFFKKWDYNIMGF